VSKLGDRGPGRLEALPAELSVVQLYRLCEIADGCHYGASKFALLLLERALGPPPAPVVHSSSSEP
jgi:hypothetical protein